MSPVAKDGESNSKGGGERSKGMGTTLVTTKVDNGRPISKPITTPIYHTSTYLVESCESALDQSLNGYLYGRLGAPNAEEVETTMAAVEQGAGAVMFSSGMAAISNTLLCFLQPGDHMVVASSLYSGTQTFITHYLTKFGVDVTFLDAVDDGIDAYARATKENTKMYYGETISNPMMKLLDLQEFGKLGGEKGIMTVVDSTFSTPINQVPLSYGIDMVIHSCTKYLGGHSDLIAGCTIMKDDSRYKTLRRWNIILGSCQSPADSVLLMRSLKTLHVRVAKHNENAYKVAQFLEQHPKVRTVLYPGLPSHPQYSLAVKIMKQGYGGMIAIELTDKESAIKFVESTKLFKLAVSLGGAESLLEHVVSMTHGDWIMTSQERERQGLTDSLVRLSVGLEDTDDQIADLTQALNSL